MASERATTWIATLRVAGMVGLALAAACRAPSEADLRGATSSSIILDEAEDRLWVTSPDDDAVVAIDPETLEVLQTYPIEGGPTALVRSRDGIAVSLGRAAGVAWLDSPYGPRVTTEVPCGGTAGLAVFEDRVFVACPDDDRVVELELLGPVTRVLRVEGRPTALAAVDGRLWVTLTKASRIVAYEIEALDRLLEDPWLVQDMLPDEQVGLERRQGYAATHIDLIAVDPGTGGLVVGHEAVDHDSDRDRAPEQGGYGSVIDHRPRIEPRLHAKCGQGYARFDGGLRVASGPSAIAARDGRLWVVHRQTDNVLVLECDDLAGASDLAETAKDELRLAAAFSVGRGPRGIAVSSDGRRAWVDVGFDHAVARLELGDGPPTAPIEPALARTRPVGASIWSPAGQRGRKLFFDAVDTHLTPSGVITCGTCHPEGGEDGLTWFLHTIDVPRKLRRTPPAWAGRPSMAPFHWDGAFTDAAELTRATVRSLMEGDGLLVDVDAVAAYLAEIPLPLARPIAPGDLDPWLRGQDAFDAAGCRDCHSGATFQDGATHAVIAPRDDPDGLLISAFTPSLIAIRARAPYLHDGRAGTLRDVLVTHNPSGSHGDLSGLSDEAIDDLLIYLESL